MRMIAFIHDHDEASAIKDCMENYGVYVQEIYTQQAQTYHGVRSPDGYRMMVADNQYKKAYPILFRHFPHLRPSIGEKIMASLLPTIIIATLGLLGFFLFIFGLSFFAA